MRVDLTPHNRDLLLELVDSEIREIGPEIRHTDHCDYRDELRAKRRELRDLHALLAHALPESTHGAAETDSRGLLGSP